MEELKKKEKRIEACEEKKEARESKYGVDSVEYHEAKVDLLKLEWQLAGLKVELARKELKQARDDTLLQDELKSCKAREATALDCLNKAQSRLDALRQTVTSSVSDVAVAQQPQSQDGGEQHINRPELQQQLPQHSLGVNQDTGTAPDDLNVLNLPQDASDGQNRQIRPFERSDHGVNQPPSSETPNWPELQDAQQTERADGDMLDPSDWVKTKQFLSECSKKHLKLHCTGCASEPAVRHYTGTSPKFRFARTLSCGKAECKAVRDISCISVSKMDPVDKTSLERCWLVGVRFPRILSCQGVDIAWWSIRVRFTRSWSPRFSQADLDEAREDLENIEYVQAYAAVLPLSTFANEIPNSALSVTEGSTRLITSQRIEELPSIWRTAKVESMGDLGKPVDIELDGRTELARARLQWLIVRDEGETLNKNIGLILEDLKRRECLIEDASGCWERDVDGKYVGWCLPMACKLRRTNIISTLLHLAPIHDLKTGLHFAISSAAFETVTLILQYGVNRKLFAPLDLEYALVIAFREGWRLPLDVKQLLLQTKKENGVMSLREEFGKFYLKRDVVSLCEAIIHRQFYRAACICLLGVVRLSPTTSNFTDDMVEYLKVRSKIVLISLLSQLGGHTVTAERNQNAIVVALSREIIDANYDTYSPKGVMWRICKLCVTGPAMTIAYNGVNVGKRQRDTASAKRNRNDTPSRMKRRHILPKFRRRCDAAPSSVDASDKGKRRVIGSLPSASKRAKITDAELSKGPELAAEKVKPATLKDPSVVTSTGTHDLTTLNHELCVACTIGNLEVLRELLALEGDRRVDPTADDSYCIRMACQNGHLEVVRELLALEGDRRVDPTAQDNYCIQLACGNGHLAVVRELLALEGDRRVDPTAKSNYCIHLACENGHLEVLRELLALEGDRRVDLTAMANYCIQLACENGHVEVLRELLALEGDRRVDPTASDNYCIRMACENGHLEVLRELLALEGDRCVDTTAKDNYCIRMACENGHVEVVRELLALKGDRRVDPTAMDNYCIRVASSNGHLEVVRVLEDDRGKGRIDARERPCNSLREGKASSKVRNHGIRCTGTNRAAPQEKLLRRDSSQVSTHQPYLDYGQTK